MTKKSSAGLSENIAGILCYVFGWVTGLIFFLIEKDNQFVRFHALQSMIVFGALFVLQIVINVLMAVLAAIHLNILIPVLVLLNSLVFIAALVLWIVLMVKAYQGERFKLPLSGDLAENYL
jgi:uncharacterized membrane protein